MIRTFLIYKLIDRCIDALFDRWTGLFVDPNEVVKSIEVGKFYREMYSIFWAAVSATISIRVENWFDSVTIISKTDTYVEVRCIQWRQVYKFDTPEDAIRYTRGRVDYTLNSMSIFSYSKGTVEKINDPDFISHTTVVDNEIHVMSYMKGNVEIPINITVRPEGIRSITP
jgi:hypothetical protein